MKDAKDTSVGKRIYLYFEGKDELTKYIRKSNRPKRGGIIIPAFVLEVSTKKKRKPKIIAVASKKYFCDDKFYGGHGFKLDAADTRIITESEYFDIQACGNDMIARICEENGYNIKTFKSAYNKLASLEGKPKPKKDK